MMLYHSMMFAFGSSIVQFIYKKKKGRGMLFALFACIQQTSKEQFERESDFSIQVGVESVTVLDAFPNRPLTLYAQNQEPLLTLITDEYGQAHFAYIPDEHQILDPNNFEGVSLENGTVLQPG